MNIGDKVRMLRGKEEGIVTRIIDNKLIEVEIEDGFQIPVLKSEVVVVATEEAEHFREREQNVPAATNARPTRSESGVFLAFRPLNDRMMAAFLINSSGYSLSYTLYEEADGLFTGLRAGTLEDQSFEKFGEYDVQRFDRWPGFVFQGLFFSPLGRQNLLQPLQRRLSLKAANFFKNKRTVGILNAEAHAFRLDTEKPVTLQPEVLTEALLSNQTNAPTYMPQNVPAQVDLHAEQLVVELEGRSKEEILQVQMQKFEQMLDAALAAGKEEITFIHGVGNGVLRQAIQKHLSQRSDIAYFKDAQKERFGYGATLVRLK